jgi:ABC-2 type transport system permease protein
MSTAPIADLTYRGYDGPLLPPTHRWWVIAWMLIRRNLKRGWMWVCVSLSAAYYLIMMAVITLTKQQADSMTPPIGMPSDMGAMPNPFNELMERVVWKDQFIHGLSFGQLWFLILVLTFGIGTIANDNKANALLVYLSKPCTKRDYILGKWMGIFTLLCGLMLIPSVIFYLYGAASFREYGFVSDDVWLFPKVVAAIGIQAAFLTSLAIGISSMFNQGRLAGATLAGLYFMSNFFTKVMEMMYRFGNDEADLKGVMPLVKNLYYASIDGLNIGITKLIFGSSGSVPFGQMMPRRAVVTVPRPDWFVIVIPIVLLSALSLWIAWRRVRAVEVVK